jgi:hypothetical protein
VKEMRMLFMWGGEFRPQLQELLCCAGMGKHLQPGSTAYTAGGARAGLAAVQGGSAGPSLAPAVRFGAGPHRLYDRTALLLPAGVPSVEGGSQAECQPLGVSGRASLGLSGRGSLGLSGRGS